MVTARRLAWWIAAGAMGLAATGLVLSLVGLAASGGELSPAPHQLFNPVLTVAFSIVGALVASRHPRNPIGWILGGTGALSGANLFVLGYSMYGQSGAVAGSLPGTEVARWMSMWIWILGYTLPMTFLFLLFPHGHLLSPRWRGVAWAAALGTVGAVAFVAFHPQAPEMIGEEVAHPFVIPEAASFLELIVIPAVGLVVVGLLGAVASLIIRFRRSAAAERQQLKWLAYASVLMILGIVVSSVIYAVWSPDPMAEEVGIIIGDAALVGIVMATGIAILRYRLYDIDVIINRSLVYGALTVLVVGLYVVVVGTLGVVLQARGSLSVSLFAAGLVAVLFQPLRERLEGGVNRLMYGERDDPYLVLSRLGQRLEATLAPEAVLPTIAETLAQTLRLPYVAIELGEAADFRIATEFGRPMEDPTVLPLTYQAETVGRLICGPRGRGEPFSGSERRLLEDVAHQAGVAVHAVRLTADLQRSRERLVSAREEERRRLRRDLHDGLGPQLASMALKIDAVRNHLLNDAESAEAGLVQLKGEMHAAIAEIRRLVYELRPPALDELGLVSAIREHVAGTEAVGRDVLGNGLKVSVEAPDPLPPLPAAVEVAAYRIALEAFTNVVRHARAAECVVRITLTDALEVEITDDGVGLPRDVRVGVGLASMRERAEELGGRYAVEPTPGGGTRVRARLPLRAAEDDD